jgi:peroxiredoxin
MTSHEFATSPTLREQIADLVYEQDTRIHADTRARLREELHNLQGRDLAASALKPGNRAPDFTLPTLDGSPLSLSATLQHGPVVLSFYRGGWCPYCGLQLRAYQAFLPQIRELGATLLAVSPQLSDHARRMAERANLSFPLLEDRGNAVARQYGLVFQIEPIMHEVYHAVGADLPAYNGDDAWELPIPGTYIIDQQRCVRYAFVNTDYTERLEPVEIILHLRRLN